MNSLLKLRLLNELYLSEDQNQGLDGAPGYLLPPSCSCKVSPLYFTYAAVSNSNKQG